MTLAASLHIREAEREPAICRRSQACGMALIHNNLFSQDPTHSGRFASKDL
jgi:hypothetical protein